MTSDDADDDMSPADAASHIEERQEWFAHANKSSQTGMCCDTSKSGPGDDEWVLLEAISNSTPKDMAKM
eukprot:9212546-Karenia_brevis.AAC.1